MSLTFNMPSCSRETDQQACNADGIASRTSDVGASGTGDLFLLHIALKINE